MERIDHRTTIVSGQTVYVNPLPTDIRDRLIWAFHDCFSSGGSRAERGFNALVDLSHELKLPTEALHDYLATLPSSHDDLIFDLPTLFAEIDQHLAGRH
jgi:hypothetical protein